MASPSCTGTVYVIQCNNNNKKTRLRVKQKNEINKEYNNFPVHGGRARTREMHSLVEKKKI